MKKIILITIVFLAFTFTMGLNLKQNLADSKSGIENLNR